MVTVVVTTQVIPKPPRGLSLTPYLCLLCKLPGNRPSHPDADYDLPIGVHALDV